MYECLFSQNVDHLVSIAKNGSPIDPLSVFFPIDEYTSSDLILSVLTHA
jgi:hypothetical protein